MRSRWRGDSEADSGASSVEVPEGSSKAYGSALSEGGGSGAWLSGSCVLGALAEAEGWRIVLAIQSTAAAPVKLVRRWRGPTVPAAVTVEGTWGWGGRWGVMAESRWRRKIACWRGSGRKVVMGRSSQSGGEVGGGTGEGLEEGLPDDLLGKVACGTFG